jgi:hypothetical protein
MRMAGGLRRAALVAGEGRHRVGDSGVGPEHVVHHAAAEHCRQRAFHLHHPTRQGPGLQGPESARIEFKGSVIILFQELNHRLQ